MLFTSRIRCYILIAILASMLPALSRGQTTFGPMQNVVGPSLGAPRSVIAADLDSDGDLDILFGTGNYDHIAWYENLDGGGTFGPQRTIAYETTRADSVLAADLDGDGDIDVLSASPADDRIAWYENIDGAGSFGPRRTITTSADYAESIFAADLDGDGDLDVLSALYAGDRIAWYENIDGNGTFGSERTITRATDAPPSVFAVDLDGDGDADVLSASENDDLIAWYENIDGAGTFGPQKTITSSADRAESVFAADLDGDGDIDVLSGSYEDDRVAWYENIDGEGSFGPQQTITIAANRCLSVLAADLDGDGDKDVLSASQYGRTMWYENIDGTGTFGPRQTITSIPAGADSIFAADLDGDGDIDILSAESWEGEISWCQNTDGAGTFGSQHILSTFARKAHCMAVTDLDDDGDLDVLSLSYSGNHIAWHENVDGAGTFGPEQIVATDIDYADSLIVADLDGDGDDDVLSASGWDDRIVWYENIDGAATFGPAQIIADSDTASLILAADLDDDGDIDVLSASYQEDRIYWYENIDGKGTFGPQRIITTMAYVVFSVSAADLDCDGDLDLLAAFYQKDRVVWYENTDGKGNFGPGAIISLEPEGPNSVFGSDLDGDGDLDVLSASSWDDRIAWYENTDGKGAFGPQQTITVYAHHPNSVFAADLDGDGDEDVLSSSRTDGRIAWYENLDGAGTFSSQQTISTNLRLPRSVLAVDLDGDGDKDVLSASENDDRVAWFENLGSVRHKSYEFAIGREGWQPFGYPGFSSPVFGNTPGEPGTLDTTATDNTNQVGIWQSPAYEIVAPGKMPTRMDTERLAGEPGTSIYVATFRVAANGPDRSRSPQIRMRTTTGGGGKSEVLLIESNFDGAFSPTPGGRDYPLIFQSDEHDSIFRCYFDMLNFYPQDSATATVMLDRVDLKSMSDPFVASTLVDREYPFLQGQDGWKSYTIPGVFAEPTFAYDAANRRLGISIADTDDFQFGFWGSSLNSSNNVAIESGRRYWAVFTVGTDIEDPQKVPEFRLRLNESRFRASQYTNIAATGSAADLPTVGNSKQYTVFFPPNMGSGGSLLCSFDLLANPSQQLLDVGSSIYLERVEVLSQPYEP
ncbi:VCBS repeat-containing protein [bacterium]|nr:VCBS repeat-containing protein [bacterium]